MHEATNTLEINSDFKTKMASILDRPLTAETIDTYAENALEELITVTEQATGSYIYNPTVRFDTNTANEDAAFRYYELEQVDEILTHIAEKAYEIKYLGEVISNAPLANEVIVPSGPKEVFVVEGDGVFEYEKTVPKLKSLLFILSNEFGVNVEDGDGLRMTRGIVREDMMRQESYYLVDIPSLSRLVLICDELGNATYVFSGKKLAAINIGPEALIQYNKDQLNELLGLDSTLGQRIVFTKNFIPNLIQGLESDDFASSRKGLRSDDSGRYLAPVPPAGYLHEFGVSQQLGVNNHVIHKVVEELGESLGETQEYKTPRSRKTTYYSPEQQRLIREVLEAKGTLLEQPPEDYQSIITFARANRVGYQTVLKAIERIGDELGDIREYKFMSSPAIGLSPTQQEKILLQLEADGYLVEKAPEGILSVGGLAKILQGVGTRSIDNAIKELGEDLGKVRKYKFGRSVAAFGYTPEQQVLITERLKQAGALSPDAPEGYLSTRALAKQWSTTEKVIEESCQSLAADLGEVNLYKFGTNIALGFSAEQQERLRQHIVAKGHSVAPEGYQPIRAIADGLGVSFPTVDKAIQFLGESLGEVQRFRFGGKITTGYSLEQQGLIKEYLSEKGIFSDIAPEGFTNVYRLATELGARYYTVAGIVDELAIKGLLGEVKTYKFKNRNAKGFSTEQKKLITRRFLTGNF